MNRCNEDPSVTLAPGKFHRVTLGLGPGLATSEAGPSLRSAWLAQAKLTLWAGFWFAVGEIRHVSSRFVWNLARYEGHSAK